ncbi:MAG: glycosyltransferase [Acidobacteria bacterium]|nr:glycosyltransferase [Acidobacteriota bacterium]
MSERRRALMISPEFPYPPTSGGRQRSFHVLGALAKFYEIDLLTFAEHPRFEEQETLERLCAHVHVVPLPHHSKSPAAFLWRNLSRAIRGVNPLIDRFSDPPVRQGVREWLHAHDYELILVEHSWIAHHITEIKASPNRGALTVLDAHNIESDLWQQYFHQPSQWWYKPALYRYWQSAREYEQRYLNQFDLVLAVSESDAKRIERLAPDTSVAVIPNGIEIHQHDVNLDSGDRSPVVGFIGSLEYLPNELGLQWFLTDVWPQVKSRVYDAQLLIIGQGESKKLVQLCRTDESIRLAGYVPSLAPHLNRIAVMIVPLWHGSGTRIKILEAWANGIAVVSTSRGAEGLDYTHMQNIWIADNAADFVTAVVYLLSDKETRDRLSWAARQLVQKYAWPVIEGQLRAALGNHQSVRI